VGGRTQQEQIDALLAEISDEVEIDARAAGTQPVGSVGGRPNNDVVTSDKSSSGLLLSA